MSLVSGPQWGVPFTLTGPDGAIAVFNDDTSPYYSGILIPEECSGLDSAEVRENLADRTEQDGAIQGAQFYGKRPVVLTGMLPAGSTTTRNEMAARIKRASNAMRKDASLIWTPDGGEQSFVKLRRQAPVRITGNWLKKFQIPLVAADPRIYSTALTNSSVLASPAAENGRSYDKAFNMSYGLPTPSGILNVTNNGDGESPPIIRIYGPGINPSITNNTTGQSLNLTFTLSTAEEYLELDLFARTIKLNGSSNRYSALNFSTSEWWYLEPDQNEIRLGWASFTAGAKMEIFYRDAWV
jgi:hypothetical protein